MISLEREARSDWRIRWYVLIGLTVGLGALFKYNFAIVAASFIVAALSIPAYRPLLLDRKILVSVSIAGMMVLPHAAWMVQHSDLVSEKTVSTLTSGESPLWLANVAKGLFAMVVSLIACCGMAVALFALFFVRKRSSDERTVQLDHHATCLLLQRFLLAVFVVLMMIVLSGHAVEFKNRWFQPFICLLPAYLTLAFAPLVLARRRTMNVSLGVTVVTMLVILATVMARPVSSRFRGKYSWLNIPYREASQMLQAVARTAAADHRCQEYACRGQHEGAVS